MRWASLLITLPVLYFRCAPFFSGALAEWRQRRSASTRRSRSAWRSASARAPGRRSAGSGAVYFDSISMLAFLLLGARYLESAARRRAAGALEPLFKLTSLGDFSPGQTVRVAPGERIPADGVVTKASSAPMNRCSPASRVRSPSARRRAGRRLGQLEQPLVMRVTRAGADTRAAAIARLAERGAASKPRLVEAAERVARHLTWVVVLTAAASAILLGDPWVAVAVLVVACPCALALAAPIVLTRASGALLAHGVLLTRGRALEALTRVTDVVLDKTGHPDPGAPHRGTHCSARPCPAPRSAMRSPQRSRSRVAIRWRARSIPTASCRWQRRAMRRERASRV
jgi:Cu2+-exporting ATPase